MGGELRTSASMGEMGAGSVRREVGRRLVGVGEVVDHGAVLAAYPAVPTRPFCPARGGAK